MGIPLHQYQEMLTRVSRNKVRGPISDVTLEDRVPSDAEPREGDLHEKIEAECRRRGWCYVHSRMDRRTTTACGVPDFVVYGDGGRMWTFEAKSRSGKLSTEQRGFMAMAERLGHRIHVVRSLREFLEIVRPA